MAVHASAGHRPARHHHRRLLRASARDRGRADGDGERACDHPRAARQASRAAAARQPHLDPRPAAQAALQALADLCLRHPGLGDRLLHRVHWRGHGHRRRVPARAAADLCAAGADRDRHRNVHGVDPRYHGVGHGHACGHQSPGGRAAGIDPDGGRRHWRAIRRARGPEDERRAAATVARPPGARGGDPLRARSHRRAGERLFHPSAGHRPMRARVPFTLVALLALLGASVAPAAGERLVVSLSNHRVMVTSNFVGDELVLFGGIEQDQSSRPRRGGYDIVVTVTGPAQSMVTFRKSRVLGIWVNADSREFENAPAYLAVLSNRPLDAISNTETLRRLQLGLDNIPLPQRASVNIADSSSDDPFRLAFIKIKTDHGLYREVSNGVTFLAPALFRASIPLPAEVPVGTYEVDVRLFVDGAQIARAPSPFEVYKSGFEQVVTTAARDHGVLYGLATSLMAVLTGWFASVVFRRD